MPLNLVVAADVYAPMRGQKIQSPSVNVSGREICFEIMSPPSHVDPNKIRGTICVSMKNSGTGSA
jgi:hypothetical protein